MKFCIYEVWDLTSNEPFYVGKGRSVEDRHRQHLKAMRKNKNGPAFHKKLRSLIDSQSPYEFRMVFTTNDENEAFTEEIKLISLYGRRDLGTGCLLNLTNGGEGISGFSFTLETRQKMSKTRKGRPSPHLGKRYKHKNPSPKKGKPWSEIQRAQYENLTDEQKERRKQNSSLAHKGQQHTEEWRKNHSIRMTGSNNANYGKIGYYANKVGPWAGKNHPNKGRKKGPDGKLYRPDELLKKFEI